MIILKPSSLYSSLFKGVRLITRQELNFIKLLRQNDIAIEIELDEGEEIFYVVEKGLKEVVRHPLFIFLLGISVDYFVNLSSSRIYDKFFSKQQPNSKVQIIIQKKENETDLFYSQEGKEIPLEQVKSILDYSKNLFYIKNYGNKKPKSPLPEKCPYPIYLEHANKIIGWGNIEMSKKGLLLKNGFIEDDKTRQRINSGELKGLSITGIVKKSRCSICGKNYIDCPHISGEVYDKKSCINNITEIELLNINIVKEPVNQEALLNIKN